MKRILHRVALLALSHLAPLSFLIAILSHPGYSQTVVKAEYYFDTDPGAGNGTPVSITPNDTTSFTGTLSAASLSPGFHRIAFRVKDNLGRWSLPEARLFYIFQTLPKASNIVKAEYYFDTDPGVGNATNLTISPDDTVTLTKLIPGNALNNGWHTVGFRTRDNLGKWTIREERSFFVGPCSTPTPPNVVGWWSMDDATSADPTIPDLAGNQPGVIVNSFPRPFNAIFDGVDDYVGMPDNDAWAFGNQDFTIELLASFATPGGTNTDPQDKIIGQSEGFGTAKKWTLSHWNNKLVLTVANGSNYTIDFGSGFAPTANQWYHLALTRAGDTLRMFVDGLKIGQQVVPGLIIPDVNAPVTIGFVEWLHLGADPGNFAGSLDEITLFNRALKQTEIATIASAGRSGKCKVLSITTGQIPAGQFGHPYSFNFSASFGQAPYKWTLVSGSLPEGVTLDSNGVLKGTPSVAGEFTIQVRVKDGTNATVQKSFVWSVSVTKQFSPFSLFKSGTSAVPGRNMDYFIQGTNNGINTDTLSILEILEAWFTYKFSSPTAKIVSKVQNVFTLEQNDSIPSQLKWEIPLLPQGSKIILYRVRLEPQTPLNYIVTGTACPDNPYEECSNWSGSILAAGTANCEAAFPAGSRVGQGLTDFLRCISIVNKAAENAQQGCYIALSQGGVPGTGGFSGGSGCSSSTSPTKAPIDPNEKLVLAPKYIKPDQLLVYPVHYENVGTIEAQDVFIRDTLSPFLDLKSVKLISTTGGSLDTTNRVVKFDLIGTNLQPDSSGYVLYSAKPKAGLPNGTIIRNRAGIKFEVFQTFMTNETINIIDGLPPTSSMKPLPDTLYQTAIPLRWSGVDSVGELKDYTIFVSVDGGSFSPFLRNTTDTSAFYLGQPGKTYRFICVAEDVAGNFEVQGSVAEATTYLKVLCANKYFRDADGDSYGSKTTFSFSCAQPTGFILDSLDCDDSRPEVHPGGTEVCSLYDENCNGENNENNVCVVGNLPLNALPALDKIQLVPNPSDGLTTLVFFSPEAENQTFQVVDPLGRVIIKSVFQVQRGENKIPIDFRKLSNGIYWVGLFSDGRKKAYGKFLKN